MTHPFDSLSEDDLRQKACVKWQQYPADVLPLWVADMDFPIADTIKTALSEHLAGNNFGYPPRGGLPGLKESLVRRLATRQGWQVETADIHLLGGIIPGLYLAALACASEGEEVIVQSPIYPPFMMAINDTRRVVRYNPLRFDGSQWEIDFEGLEELVTPATRLLMFCNPHNPSGRVFRREELERLAEFVLEHRLWVVSDELHSDLTYPGQQHIPFASLSDEVAQRTITLCGPTKTFNIAGLKIGFLIAQNPQLLERVKSIAGHLVSGPNVMAQAAAMAAYETSDDWLEQTINYLDGNRHFVSDFVEQELPQVRFAEPEGTYLAWLDFSGVTLDKDLNSFLLEDCKVGLNDGPAYGPGGEGFTRLNFATSRSILKEALMRIRNGLQEQLVR